jgi:hypothetical protein
MTANVKRLGRRALVLTMSILIVGTVRSSAEDEPGPFERLFRAMRHATFESRHRSTHHVSHKQSASGTETSNPRAATVEGSAPPSEKNTRSATRAAGKKGEDLRYGTPVAGKPGLVTSPYAPNGGYIDVRGFAPGTPVKDPYTGKIFLTP